jgi:outer membrane protein OmpA-like peptidoglycan-associated protein
MGKHSSALVVMTLFALACTGPRGLTGPPGPTGMTGAQGPAGQPGLQGQSGMAASQKPGSTGWISLRDILFDSDTADLRTSERNKISDVAAYLSQNPSVRVGIDGSTDASRGTRRHDQNLSKRRIANVRDALIRAGVSAGRIETGRFGVERVECDNATEECARHDGRVEVLGRSS